MARVLLAGLAAALALLFALAALLAATALLLVLATTLLPALLATLLATLALLVRVAHATLLFTLVVFLVLIGHDGSAPWDAPTNQRRNGLSCSDKARHAEEWNSVRSVFEDHESFHAIAFFEHAPRDKFQSSLASPFRRRRLG